MPVESYRQLTVWQKSLVLVKNVYGITSSMPPEERFGLASQMRRAAISIPANIAEGSRRGTRKDYRHFLTISFGSGSELETYLEIIKLLPWSNDMNLEQVASDLNQIMKMLNVMISKLN